mgnify:FL=1
MKPLYTFLILLAFPIQLLAGDWTIERSGKLSLYIDRGEAEVVRTAGELLTRDFANVMDVKVSIVTKSPKAQIVAGTLSNRSFDKAVKKAGIDVAGIRGKHEAFLVRLVGKQLWVVGSDKRGTAYGMLEISRELGVSPWEWWADVIPLPKDRLTLPDGFVRTDAPAVPYRGIFINDEDWGMMPWASKNYEPRMRAANGGEAEPVKGEIGPYTHARIFELLLRLRSNVFWPAMHGCSLPFYSNWENQKMADRYGIVVSTSHCEPMMRNANGEWKPWADNPNGSRYNYVDNRDSVLLFWKQRVKALRNSDCIYTLGMRGIHDGPMQGAKTIPEQVTALTSVLKDQRQMLSEYVNSDITKIPQQFVPYKEVLDCYREGLEVPDDVTLMWCDDNYGYITHMPTADEKKRTGGNGIYYHISYWGRPHDYTWLPTVHPELMLSELLRGYDHGINTIWILNVGDVKPMEYETQLFMDLAWNPEQFRSREALDTYTDAWYTQQLGIDAQGISRLMTKWYDFCWPYKPEWMGGTRTEEKDPSWKLPHDLDLNEAQLRQRLAQAAELAWLQSNYAGVPEARKAAFFELVEYPVLSTVGQSQKWHNWQLARHGRGYWEASDAGEKLVQECNETYNTLLDGKWRGMISNRQRRLADYMPVPKDTAAKAMPQGQKGLLIYESTSVVGETVARGTRLEIPFSASGDAVSLEIFTLPRHPEDGKQIRYSVSIDGQATQTLEFHTEGRSEEWKRNVYSNRAIRKVTVPVDSSLSEHTLTVEALDEGISLQKVFLKEK